MKRIELRPVVKRTRQEAERAALVTQKFTLKQYGKARKSFKRTFSKKRNQRRAIYAGSAALILLLTVGLFALHTSAQQDKHQLIQSIQTKEKQLDTKQDILQTKDSQLQQVKQEKTQVEQQVEQKDQQIQDLNAQLQAKRDAQAADIKLASYVAPVETQSQPESSYVAQESYSAPTSGSCVTGYASGDFYLDKIIAYESSGNSCATNPGGCFGLLQACPGAPLRDACGGSPACQIAWFQANKTGGRSWSQVWQHELDYGWW